MTKIALSDILPVLENMGFRVIDEHPFLILPQGGVQDLDPRFQADAWPKANRLRLIM